MQDFDGEAVPALLRDFRAMRASMLKSGLFKSNKAYYVWKLVSTFCLLGGAVATLLAARESMLALVSSFLTPSPHQYSRRPLLGGGSGEAAVSTHVRGVHKRLCAGSRSEVAERQLGNVLHIWLTAVNGDYAGPMRHEQCLGAMPPLLKQPYCTAGG